MPEPSFKNTAEFYIFNKPRVAQKLHMNERIEAKESS
jgi:hypothetical protein